jgi:hypothetical protein
LNASLRYIVDRKDLLAKGMKELFDYIINIKRMTHTFSLAQERGFAAFVITFLQGKLENLKR